MRPLRDMGGRGMLFDGGLIKQLAPELTASSPAAAIVGSGGVTGVMLCQLPPALVVRAAALAGFVVVAVVFVMA